MMQELRKRLANSIGMKRTNASTLKVLSVVRFSTGDRNKKKPKAQRKILPKEEKAFNVLFFLQISIFVCWLPYLIILFVVSCQQRTKLIQFINIY